MTDSYAKLFAQRRDFVNTLSWVYKFVQKNSDSGKEFFITETLLCLLHKMSTQNLVEHPGSYRVKERRNVRIGTAAHSPPDHSEVTELMKDYIKTINDMWDNSSPFQIAAYAMWRLNWIHPFMNGNGRTSRLFSYLLLNMKIGKLLHGKRENVMPFVLGEQAQRRAEYVKALEAADKTHNPIELENLIIDVIGEQLRNS